LNKPAHPLHYPSTCTLLPSFLNSVLWVSFYCPHPSIFFLSPPTVFCLVIYIITIFPGLSSSNEWEHAIFGLLRGASMIFESVGLFYFIYFKLWWADCGNPSGNYHLLWTECFCVPIILLLMRNPHWFPQCDGIWKKSLWEVIGAYEVYMRPWWR
jgi:hypothetical protein